MGVHLRFQQGKFTGLPLVDEFIPDFLSLKSIDHIANQNRINSGNHHQPEMVPYPNPFES
jgi:hypothetical protein